MSKSNFDIKLKEHFKLYISIKDKISFESELLNNNIKYYFDFDEQCVSDEYLRYYFLDSEKEKINHVLIKNGIITFTESNIIGDFQESGKIMKVYAIVTIGFIVALVLVSIIIDVIKSYTN